MPRNLLFDRPDLTEDKMRYSKDLWRQSDTPLRHSEKIVYAGPWDAARKNILSVLNEEGATVVICGKRGTGKTQMAVEVIRAYCWSGVPSKYTKAMDVFLSIREGMEEKSERSAVLPYLKRGLLVIDAMEERGETKWEDRMLNYIIDCRYDGMMETLLITNQERVTFSESIGPSIISRIHEAGAVIECDWESYREKK